jgi:hypothetical protein
MVITLMAGHQVNSDIPPFQAGSRKCCAGGVKRVLRAFWRIFSMLCAAAFSVP